jgi:hypothetical protein
MADDEPTMDDLVTDALSTMFREKKDGTLLNRFVVVAEVIDPEGQESLWLASNSGMAPWSMVGFLEYGKSIASAGITRADD